MPCGNDSEAPFLKGLVMPALEVSIENADSDRLIPVLEILQFIRDSIEIGLDDILTCGMTGKEKGSLSRGSRLILQQVNDVQVRGSSESDCRFDPQGF